MASLSPKKLARAIGVSESSLKRWTDDGLLVCARTAGGHRRIDLPEAVRFIRHIGATVVRPDLLGLPDLAALPVDWSNHTATAPADALHAALEAGHAVESRAIVQSLYLAGWTPAAIFDGPMREALARIGTLWLHAEWGIVVEHRATDICIQAINQLRMLAAARGSAAPVAVGCAFEHDPYLVPSLMASAVIGELGFADVNLGALTPAQVLFNAAQHYRARLVWVCISSSDDPRRTISDLVAVAARLAAADTTVIAGGRILADVPAAQLPGVTVARSMLELEAFARGVLAARAAPAR